MKYKNLAEKPVHGTNADEDLESKKNINNMEKFHIVGIGGSAGSLDALKKFFNNLPSDLGIGFVLVQHLDPTHVSSLSEILSKYTSMTVVQVEDSMEVEKNHVYVIPPNKEMYIQNGKLHLSSLVEPHGLRLPINLFLKSLAEDRKNKSISVILSGFGSDGTNGIKAIKSEGGMVIVQDPKTTESDNMPINAINTGLVDFILPPEQIPDKLTSYIRSDKIITKTDHGVETGKYLPEILNLIKIKTGNDFLAYKKSTILRRIYKRANIHQIDNLKEYTLYLHQNPEEIDHLFLELLINVTSFFRDPEAFDIIKNKALPELLATKNEDDAIRVWAPGCSSGEEIYSLAIIIREVIENIGKTFEVQIFGTDIDKNAINKARKAIYPENIKLDVGEDRLKRFFIKKDGNYQIKKEIREMVVFSVHNVLKDPPFAKLDMISCRNLLIYLKRDSQKSLLKIFNYALNMNGLLVLGPSESIGEAQDYFQNLNKKWRIFKSIKSPKILWRQEESPVIFSPNLERSKSEIYNVEKVDLTNLATQKLLEVYTPPSAIINDSGEILYTNGKMGKYLELPPGKARLNIFDMIKIDINFKLRSAVQNAISKKKDIIIKEFSSLSNDESCFIKITIKPILEPEIMKNLLIVSFENLEIIENKENEKLKLDLDTKSEKSVAQLEKELKETKERLNITIREMETSQEQLKATNEELQSMNEESQSTNEELETSKEEMQSINEELTTVNSELQTKIDELVFANDDMKNLINSTEIATIFLDKNLNIRNFTPEARALIKLRKSDIGRPISDINTKIKYKHLKEDIKKVLDKFILKEKEVQNTSGIWYLMRIIPYKTSENLIDGVVVTFIDINQRKITENKVEKALEYSEDIFNTVREPLLVLDKNLQVISANNSFYKKFNVNERQTLGIYLHDLGNHQWEIPKLRDLLEKIIPENKEFNDYEIVYEFPEIGPRHMILNARRINREENNPLILLAIEDKS